MVESILVHRLRYVMAGLAVVAVVLSLLVVAGAPPSSRLWANLNWTILCVAAVAIGIAGTATSPPDDRTARLLFTLGLATYGMGQLLWDAQLLLGVAGEPALSDVGYLGAALPFAAGLVAEARSTERGRRTALLLDACVVSVSVAVVVLALFGRLALEMAPTELAAIVWLLYPILFLSVAGGGVVLAIASSAYPRASVTLLAGLCATGIYWLIWLQQAVAALPSSNVPINHLFTISLFLLGMGAATWRTMPPRTVRDADYPAVTLVPIGAFTVAFVTEFLVTENGPDILGLAAVLAATGLVLIMARQTLLLREREKARADLELVRERLISVLDNIPGLAWTTDANLRITSLRGRVAIAMGLPEDPDGADDPGAFLAAQVRDGDWDRLRGAHVQALAGVSETLEITAGDRILVVHVTPETAGGPKPVGVVGLALDVTAERAAVARVAEAARLEILGRLAGGIAHDFNNLLTAINGYAELAKLRAAPDDPIRGDVEQIELAGKRAAQLTRQILAFARQTPTEPESIDVARLVRSLQPMLDRLVSEDVRMEVAMPDEALVVEADRTQIEQLVLNLVVNAREAMPHGGRIDIMGRRFSNDEGSWVELAVADSGVGMDESTRARIFDPFFTTKEGGTGLGLATVYGAVRNAGGRIEVESVVGSGSRFRIQLPAKDAAADGTAAAAQGPLGVSRDCHRDAEILVVDDNEAVMRLAGDILSRAGYLVRVAAGPLAAIDEAAAMPRLDILVTDLVMPVMSGLQLADRLRTERPDIRVLVISGYSDRVLADRPLPENAALLAKPFDAEQLVESVDGLWCEARG